MIGPPDQLAAAPIPARLHDRLGELGVGAVCLRPSGRARAITPLGWTERAVIDAPPFTAAVKRLWPRLAEAGHELVAVWPGLSLAPLHELGRGGRCPGGEPTELAAALVPGPNFTDSEQFRAACDAQRIDAAVARRRVDRARLFHDAEARRLAKTLGWMRRDTAEVGRRLDELEHMSGELTGSYEELSLLYKFSNSMTVNQRPAEFLDEACRELRQCAALRWLGLRLTNQEPRLEDLAGRLFTAGALDAACPVVDRIGRALADAHREATEPVIINDVGRLGIPGLGDHARSLLVVPLRKGGQLLGLLFGADKADGSEMGSVDSKLCDSLGNSLTIFLENMMLYGDVQAMFLGTLHALTAAIDAKDSYTHGHSERVAGMSRDLAAAAGLDEHTVERVYLSGLVHDVGKIGVPEAVLAKPGKLTDHEYNLIKMHPEIGGRILADIPQMRDLVPGVLYHHERWDGRGYPRGLAGREIPLFGRLIGIADAFDAMSSNRTYRAAMNPRQVLDEIAQCRGKQFDPGLAEVFVNLDFTTYEEMIHRQLDAPPQAEARCA